MEVSTFSTPNSREIFGSLKRILAQSDELIADLQLINNESVVVRHNFLEIFSNLTEAIERKDLKLLKETANVGRRFINGIANNSICQKVYSVADSN